MVFYNKVLVGGSEVWGLVVMRVEVYKQDTENKLPEG